MCSISPSRCWCWAPNMWSWNSYDRRKGGMGMRTEPRKAVRAGPREEASNLGFHGRPNTTERPFLLQQPCVGHRRMVN